MVISTGSQLERLWRFTFLFSRNMPEQTSKLRFWLRIVFLPVLVCFAIMSVLTLFVVGTVAANVVTVLSGNGICCTWRRPRYYIRKFDPVLIGRKLISRRMISGIIGTPLVVCFLWYGLSYGMIDFGWSVLTTSTGLVAVSLAVFGVIYLADVLEEDGIPEGATANPIVFVNR